MIQTNRMAYLGIINQFGRRWELYIRLDGIYHYRPYVYRGPKT